MVDNLGSILLIEVVSGRSKVVVVDSVTVEGLRVAVVGPVMEVVVGVSIPVISSQRGQTTQMINVCMHIRIVIMQYLPGLLAWGLT